MTKNSPNHQHLQPKPEMAGIHNYQSSGTPRREECGYDALVDIMAEMRLHGAGISPVVHSLIIQLYETNKATENRYDQLARKYTRLQAEHLQLSTEFNSYCKDAKDGWQANARQSLYDEMCRSVDSINTANMLWRDNMAGMFAEHMRMSNDTAALRGEVAELRKEVEALKAESDANEEK
ncbi:hypothetical protein AAE478_010223 [Parahypoxylon ruwenzoriense]